MAEGRVILQPDWENIIDGAQREKIWAIFENSAGTRTHSSLVLGEYTSDKDGKEFSSNDFKARFERKNERSVDVTCKWGDETVLHQRFAAMTKQFADIHENAKYIRGLDVTNGGLGISAACDNNLFIWDTTTGEVRRKLEGHFGDIYSCRFFPSGVVALTAGADMSLRVWAADTGVCAATLVGHAGGVNETAIIDRGRNVLSCSRDGTVRLWDVSTQQPLHIYELAPIECALNYPINSCCLAGCPQECETPNGKLVIAACESGRLIGCMLEDEFRQKLFELKLTSAVNCCCSLESLHPYHIACGTQDGQLYAVDVRRPELPIAQADCRSRGAILSLTVIDNRIWATSSDGSAFTCEQFLSRKVSTDGVSGKPEAAKDGIVELTGADCEPVTRLATDGNNVFTGCRDGIIRKYLLKPTLED